MVTLSSAHSPHCIIHNTYDSTQNITFLWYAHKTAFGAQDPVRGSSPAASDPQDNPANHWRRLADGHCASRRFNCPPGAPVVRGPQAPSLTPTAVPPAEIRAESHSWAVQLRQARLSCPHQTSLDAGGQRPRSPRGPHVPDGSLPCACGDHRPASSGPGPALLWPRGGHCWEPREALGFVDTALLPTLGGSPRPECILAPSLPRPSPVPPTPLFSNSYSTRVPASRSSRLVLGENPVATRVAQREARPLAWGFGPSSRPEAGPSPLSPV